MDHTHIEQLKLEYERLSMEGFRVLANASKDITPRQHLSSLSTPYSKADESDLILNG
jgi:Mg2+-importing ATPase